MSIESWKREFYPTPAANATNDDITAIEHSLKKWVGLSKSNLDKHNLRKVESIPRIVSAKNDDNNDGDSNNGFVIYFDEDEDGNDDLYVTGRSCALCQRYSHGCSHCPLYEASKGINCSDIGSPYDEWMETGNIKPMIKALKKSYLAAINKDLVQQLKKLMNE